MAMMLMTWLAQKNTADGKYNDDDGDEDDKKISRIIYDNRQWLINDK